MSKTTPAQQFGYLELTYSSDKEIILVKANTIKTIDSRKMESITTISFSDDHNIMVNETIDQIIDQLECIHPSLR